MRSFSELPLSSDIRRAVEEMGYEVPSPIQAEALPFLLEAPTDFLGLAATGTGKTAAFGIPMLEKVDPLIKKTQALILCPTRELAQQVAGQISLLGKYKKIKALPVYGGTGYSDQVYGMKHGAPVIVGTPGRLVDHMERGTLKLDEVHTVILDEADEMISMGFKKDLDKILSSTPRASSNIWLFSATMGQDVRKVADKFLRSPKQVQVNRVEVVSSSVRQICYFTKEANKPEILCKLIDAADDIYGLIFCQTKNMVASLTQILSSRGYTVDCLHGDRDQNQRTRTMQAFREHKVKLLVCTDVASRGLDVKDVTHVINYSIPRELEVYLHRIGRTARAGKSGVAMSLVTPAQRSLLPRLEKLTKTRFEVGVIPTRRDIGAKKVQALLEKFTTVPGHERALELLEGDWATALADLTPAQVASRFVAMAMPDLFAERAPKLIAQDEVLGEEQSQGRPRRFRFEQKARRSHGNYPPRKRSGSFKKH